MNNHNSIDIASTVIPSGNRLPADLSRLSVSLLEQAASYNPTRRQQFIWGRWLLAELLYLKAGITALPVMTTQDNGRPRFIDLTLPDFNISHSGDQMMVALANHQQIGLDIEQYRPRNNLLKLARYSFSEMESQWLSQLPEAELAHGFWRLWTIRESILKACAKGVWQMKEIAIDPYCKTITADFLPSFFVVNNFINDIYISITSLNEIDLIMHWRVNQKEQLINLRPSIFHDTYWSKK